MNWCMINSTSIVCFWGLRKKEEKSISDGPKVTQQVSGEVHMMSFSPSLWQWAEHGLNLLLARVDLLSIWALARPGQGCLCSAKSKNSKPRRTRSLQSGGILGSGSCGCQEVSDGTQAHGCRCGLWDGWTHGFLWEDDTRVGPQHAVGRCCDELWQLLTW